MNFLYFQNCECCMPFCAKASYKCRYLFSTLVCNIPVYSCVHNFGCVFKSHLWSTLVTFVWSLNCVVCIKFKCLLMFCLLIITTILKKWSLFGLKYTRWFNIKLKWVCQCSLQMILALVIHTKGISVLFNFTLISYIHCRFSMQKN